MRKFPILLAIAASAVTAGSIVSAATLAATQDVQLSAGSRLALKLRAGNIVVEGGGEAGVARASITWTCGESDLSRCEDIAAGLGLSTNSTGSRMSFGVAGMPNFSRVRLTPTLHLVVPAGHAIEVDLGAGNVRFSQLANDIEVDVGAGNVEGELILTATGRVDLASHAGRATLHLPNGDVVGSGLVGSSIEWSREGGGISVEIDLGAGDIDLELQAAEPQLEPLAAN